MKQQVKTRNKGFTLIELMVAMVVSIIVVAAIYSVYVSQTRVQITHEITLELQESLRAALSIMASEIRTAGADPRESAGAGILKAKADELWFTRDVTGGDIDGRPTFDGTTDNPSENIRYRICPDGHLGRDIQGNDNDNDLEILLDNVGALNFVYLDRNDDPINDPNDNIEKIRSITVTILAESGQSDRGFLSRYRDDRDYENAWGEPLLLAQNDNVRRLQLSTNVTCRNLAAD